MEPCLGSRCITNTSTVANNDRSKDRGTEGQREGGRQGFWISRTTGSAPCGPGELQPPVEMTSLCRPLLCPRLLLPLPAPHGSLGLSHSHRDIQDVSSLGRLCWGSEFPHSEPGEGGEELGPASMPRLSEQDRDPRADGGVGVHSCPCSKLLTHSLSFVVLISSLKCGFALCLSGMAGFLPVDRKLGVQAPRLCSPVNRQSTRTFREDAVF